MYGIEGCPILLDVKSHAICSSHAIWARRCYPGQGTIKKH